MGRLCLAASQPLFCYERGALPPLNPPGYLDPEMAKDVPRAAAACSAPGKLGGGQTREQFRLANRKAH